jgi:hypothetical protein
LHAKRFPKVQGTWIKRDAFLNTGEIGRENNPKTRGLWVAAKESQL